MFHIFLTALSSILGDAMPLILKIFTFCKKCNTGEIYIVMYPNYDCVAMADNDLEMGDK